MGAKFTITMYGELTSYTDDNNTKKGIGAEVQSGNSSLSICYLLEKYTTVFQPRVFDILLECQEELNTLAKK